MLVFRKFPKGITEIVISFETESVMKQSPNGMYMAEKGSLLFALPIKYDVEVVEYEKNDVERKFPYCDYFLKGDSDWNYAFTDRTLSYQECEMSDVPFSFEHPSVILRAKMCHIDWGYEEGYETICSRKPNSRQPLDQSSEMTLIPYGCAKLRMTEMPFVKEKK
jgi:hypothetical protein